jgi:hypothetical protein
MWCTSCRNPFDWRTGKKISGLVHNPHYHEYAMANQEWTGCQEGRGMWPWPYTPHLTRNISSKMMMMINPAQTNDIMLINRFMIECSVNVQNPPAYNPDTYLNLRKKRVLQHIDDNEWAKQLSARETARERAMKKCRLDEFLVAVGKDCFEVFLGKEWKPSTEDLQSVILQLKAARLYYNEQLISIGIHSRVGESWVMLPL